MLGLAAGPASPSAASEAHVGRVASGIRFIVGVAMVAAGVALALPLGRLVAEGAARNPTPAPVVVPAAPPAMAVSSPAWAPPAAPVAPVAPAPPWPQPDHQPPVDLRQGYVPPTPPDRLPPVPTVLGAEGPGMNGTYRSTLDVPPPPLLDAQAAPPPVTAWTTPAAASPMPPAPPAGDLVPATYVVRDGDDLTAISSRFYGHAGAATAVWEANRDVIPDPNLLPIGAELRLPPSWTVGGPHRGAAGGAIEPPPGMAAPRVVAASQAPAGSEAWLGPNPAAAAAVASSPPRAGGGTVRLAPGETLESLAVRFYGDRSAAWRIWEANRDRLRSPELAVAGMELRLP